MGAVLRFGVVGACTTALNFLLFTGLIAAGVHYLAACSIGWAVGVGLSYGLNKRFTFALGPGVDLRELLVFIGGYVVQLGLGLASYAILIGGLGLGPSPAFAINLILVATFSFVFMRTAVFRQPPAAV